MSHEKNRLGEILLSLVEGQLSPEEWLKHWRSCESELRALVKPGQFLRLKPRERLSPIENAFDGVKEAASILEAAKIPFQSSKRFESDHSAFQVRRKQEIQFGAAAISVAEEEFHASCNEEFLERMHNAYRDEHEPKDLRRWLTEKFSKEFLWVEQPPRWNSQPEWQFYKGVPAVFITQYTIPENDVTRSRYTWDQTIYIFGYRFDESSKGYRTGHIVIKQANEP